LDSNDGGVAALAVFGIFILPVLGWIVVRFLAHQERMEMIRNGITPPPQGRNRGRDWRNAQNFGAPGGPTMPNMPNMPGPAMGKKKSCDDDDFSLAAQRIVLRRGIRLTFIGLALTIGMSFTGYSDGPMGPMWHPGPQLLFGLIPMFIGLSQITSAMLAGATLGPAMYGPGPGAPFPGPPFNTPPPPFGGPPPTYDSSYTYRPGDAQELRPPTPPPERRS
jgi:hypothetical protein